MVTASNRFRNILAGEAGSPGMEDEAYRRVNEFDPYAAVGDTARGAFGSFRDQLQREIAKLRGDQVGMGRLKTGFATDDEDELVTGLGDRLNNEILRSSMSAASMDAQNRQYGHSAAAGRTGRFYDILAGQRDYETAEANARKDRGANLLGAGLGAAGMVLGGPAGSALAGGVGNFIQSRWG